MSFVVAERLRHNPSPVFGAVRGRTTVRTMLQEVAAGRAQVNRSHPNDVP
jgi:hypothetical protein